METNEQYFFIIFALLAIIVFTFPLFRGIATRTMFGGIQLGVVVAWGATVAFPLMILGRQITGLGKES